MSSTTPGGYGARAVPPVVLGLFDWTRGLRLSRRATRLPANTNTAASFFNLFTNKAR